MFKKNFIAGLCSVDANFRLQLWDRLLQQATIIVNLLQQSRICPYLPAYTHIYGYFYYNCTLISPPVTNVVINNRKKDRASWSPHGEPGWYTGPGIKHYRCHETYIPKPRVERISVTVGFFPRKFSMPKLPSKYSSIHAAQYFIRALKNPAPVIPLVTLVNAYKEAFIPLANIFEKVTPPEIPLRLV